MLKELASGKYMFWIYLRPNVKTMISAKIICTDGEVWWVHVRQPPRILELMGHELDSRQG
jgi:hypothetical protein